MLNSSGQVIKNEKCKGNISSTTSPAEAGKKSSEVSIADANENGGIDPPKYVEHENQVGKEGFISRWLLLRKRVAWSRRNCVYCTDSSSHWKSISLRAPVLGGFVLFSISMIILLEILSHISSGNGNANGGGVTIALDNETLSTATTFCYLYLPTVLAVFYSMLWSWVDLDAKRLEPWFQLSRDRGAKAEDSLLLQYPFEFLPFIPITAFRRKHWCVFFAGTIMLIVFWVITPLQSAIFNTGSVIRVRSTWMGTSTSLIPIKTQASALNANFLNIAYGISWLGQKLPPFTTSEFAIPSFRPTSDISSLLPTETWTTEATAFVTNLTCSPAKTILTELTYTFDNGNGCIVPDLALPDANHISPISNANSAPHFADFMLLYIGYYDDAQVDYSLQNPQCSIEHSNNFLALFASASSRTAQGVYSNLTALFCVPSYHVTNISVVVNASSRAIMDWTRPEPEIISDLPNGVFNKTAFEYILGAGVNPTRERSNFPDSAVLEQYPRLEHYNLTRPVSNMVGFAVALNPMKMEDLSQPVALQTAFQMAHQLLFTTALNVLTESIPLSMLNIRAGVRKDNPGAIVMVRSVSLVVECAFGLVALLTSCLWYMSHRRKSNLESDPDSIAGIMSIVHKLDSSDVYYDGDGTLTSEATKRILTQKKFYLQAGAKTPQLMVLEPSGLSVNKCAAFAANSEVRGEQLVPAIQPPELQLWVGSLLSTALAVALSGLALLQAWSSRHQGVSLPSDNPVVLSIVENYAPTAFATFLEPVWVILNRLLCLLMPFEELRKGNAKASTTIEVNYTSLPPQLVFFRAIRARHFLLAVVCVIAVSTNILAVALAALLTESPTNLLIPFASFKPLLAHFNRTAMFDTTLFNGEVDYFDHFYVALSNLSGTPLPAWVDQEFFYLPFDIETPFLNTNELGNLQELHGTTTGIGAAVTCYRMSSNPDSGNNTVLFQANQDGSRIQFSTSYVLSNGTNITCFSLAAATNPPGNRTINEVFIFPTGEVALEVMQTMQTGTGIDDGGFCSSIIVAGWVRSSPSPDGLSPGATAAEDFGKEVTSTFLTCTQSLRTAVFDVVVDTTGHIIRSKQQGGFLADPSPYFEGNVTDLALFQRISDLIAPATTLDFEWHNDSFTSDWVNSLLGSALNSSALVNPSASVPDAVVIAPLMESLYRQLFAILLGLNTQLFSKSQPPMAMTAEALVSEIRLFVSPLMFTISIILLGFHLAVAILYYANRPRCFLPRMPTSIGSLIAIVSASRALEDFSSTKQTVSDDPDQRYGYGRFIGTDGKTHIGIERQRYVVPLECKNPEVKKRKWTWKRSQNGDTEMTTWL